MKTTTALMSITACFLMTVLITEAGAVDARPAPVQDEEQTVEDRIARLEKRVETLEAQRSALTLSLETNQELLARIFSWFRSLPAACDALDTRMESARRNGFEKAGPNPAAKKDVLEGLRAFAAALDAANPVKPKTKRN